MTEFDERSSKAGNAYASSSKLRDHRTELAGHTPGTFDKHVHLLREALHALGGFFLLLDESLDVSDRSRDCGSYCDPRIRQQRHRFAETGFMDVHAGLSLRGFASAEANVLFPTVAHGALTFEAHAEQLHAPTVAFFGAGNDSPRSQRGTFGYDRTTAGGSVRVQATTHAAVGGSLDWLQARADGQSLHTPQMVMDPAYARAGAFAELDTRDAPGYTRNGTLARIEWSNYDQVNGSAFAFRRVDAEVQQYIPLARERWVFAFRGVASTTDTSRGADVPYFLMPELGGSHLLRGYSPWRFRDRNRLLLSGEYRWPAGPFVDMAIFMDAGKVTAGRADLNLRGLRTSQGIGVRIHTPNATVTRIEVARSREGTSLIFAFSPSF